MEALLKHINLNYHEIKVLEDFDLEVPSNEITCIVGPSGCGKTSILNILADLNQNYSGNRAGNHKQIGYVFQEDRLLPWETVYENIKLVRETENSSEIDELLKALELEGFKDKYPKQLSGGMRQRVAIARSFYYHSTLLLMDEPFKSLDYDLRLNLIKYLSYLWEKQQNTIVFVTHDIDEALLLGHQIIVLSRRPAEVIGRYYLDRIHGKRDVMNDDHVTLRSKIIKQMSYERENRDEKISQ